MCLCIYLLALGVGHVTLDVGHVTLLGVRYVTVTCPTFGVEHVTPGVGHVTVTCPTFGVGHVTIATGSPMIKIVAVSEAPQSLDTVTSMRSSLLMSDGRVSVLLSTLSLASSCTLLPLTFQRIWKFPCSGNTSRVILCLSTFMELISGFGNEKKFNFVHNLYNYTIVLLKVYSERLIGF